MLRFLLALTKHVTPSRNRQKLSAKVQKRDLFAHRLPGPGMRGNHNVFSRFTNVTFSTLRWFWHVPALRVNGSGPSPSSPPEASSELVGLDAEQYVSNSCIQVHGRVAVNICRTVILNLERARNLCGHGSNFQGPRCNVRCGQGPGL